jgi:hypothetical protein
LLTILQNIGVEVNFINGTVTGLYENPDDIVNVAQFILNISANQGDFRNVNNRTAYLVAKLLTSKACQHIPAV